MTDETLDRALDALPRAIDPARDLWPGIRARIGAAVRSPSAAEGPFGSLIPPRSPAGPSIHRDALPRPARYCPTRAPYAAASNNPSVAPGSASLTLSIHPSPYGSAFTSAGSLSNRGFTSTTAPATGM